MSYSGKGIKRWRKEHYQHWEGVYAASKKCTLSEKYCHTYQGAMAEKTRQESKWDVQLRIYRCKYCGSYHLTSKT